MQRLERRSDRWISAGLSVLLHGALIGALIYGWWTFHHQPAPPPTLAIDATVVSSKSLKGGPAGVEHKPSPSPPQTVSPPPVQEVQPQTVTPPPQTTPPPSLSDDQTVPSPPKPTVDKAIEQKAKEQAEQKAEAEAQRKAAERKAEQESEKRAAAEAERKAKEAEAKKRAEQQRVAEAKRKAEAERKAEEQRKAAEAKALAANQAELAQGIDAEQKLLAERSGPAMASWAQLITAKIQRNWYKPPSARPGIDCVIDITQLPDGEVSTVKVGACNGDDAVRQSIQDAAFRASPLPAPPNPDLFERQIQVEFKPTE